MRLLWQPVFKIHCMRIVLRHTMVLALLLCVHHPLRAQQPAGKMYTSDISRYWQAYDRVQSTTDTALQLRFIQQLYLAKGTPGLQEFAVIRGWTAAKSLQCMQQYPAFWQSVRALTEHTDTTVHTIQLLIRRYHNLYKA